MRGIVQRETNSLRTADSTKAFAFLQFLHETDELKAGAFIGQALARGGAVAAEEVFGKTLDELDAEYRAWALLTIPAAEE